MWDIDARFKSLFWQGVALGFAGVAVGLAIILAGLVWRGAAPVSVAVVESMTVDQCAR